MDDKNVSFSYDVKYTKEQLIDMIDKNPSVIADIFCENDHLFEYNRYTKDLIKEALKIGYKPNFNDVKKAPRLYNNFDFIKELVYKDPNNFKYISHNICYPPNKSDYIELGLYAIRNGYKPTLDDINNNYALRKSSVVMEYLIKENPDNFKYIGHNISLIREFSNLANYSIRNGYKPTIEDIKNNHELGYYKDICNCFDIKDIIKYISNTEIIESLDDNIIENITYQDYLDNNKLSLNKKIILKFINNNPNIILNSEYLDDELINIAINNGFKLKQDDMYDSINIDLLLKNIDVLKQLIDQDPEIIEILDDLDLKTESNIISYAFTKGYRKELLYKLLELDLEDFISIEENNKDVIKYILNWNYDFLYISLDVFKYLVDKNYKFSKEVLSKCINKVAFFDKHILDYYLKRNHDIDIEYLLENTSDRIKPYVIISLINNKKDINNIISICKKIGYTLTSIEYEKIISSGYNISKDELTEAIINSFNCMYMLCLKDKDYINYCNNIGTKTKLNIIFNNYMPTNIDMTKYSISKEPLVMEYLVMKDPKYIEYSNDHDLIKRSIMKHNTIKIKELNDKYLILEYNQDIKIPFNSITSIIDKETLYTLFKRSDSTKEILKKVSNNNPKLTENIPNNYVYKYIFETIINNSNNIKIDENIIILDEYEFNIYNIEPYLNKELWLKIQRVINKKMPIIYASLNIKLIDRIKLINNYQKYSDFLNKCNINEDQFIQHELGKNNEWLDLLLKALTNNKENELINIYNYIKRIYKNNNDIDLLIETIQNYNQYKELFDDLVNNNIVLDEKTKNQLSLLLSSNNLFSEKEKPHNIKELCNFDQIYKYKCAYLLSSSKNKKESVCKILFNKSLEELLNLLDIYGDTVEFKKLKFNSNNIEFKKLVDEVILYVSFIDLIVNMDNERIEKFSLKMINDFDLILKIKLSFNNYEEIMRDFYEKEINLNLTHLNTEEKEVNLKEKEYCLLVHSKSDNETIEEIIYGISSLQHNFISLSSISWRNLSFYGALVDRIVFGYESIPDNSFVESSTVNMSTNNILENNEIKEIKRKQRGILELSNSINGNAEILCLRKGLKPTCIIIPGDRKPTKEELDISNRYNLKLVHTQYLYETINSPETETISDNTKIKLPTYSSKEHKIAVFTDAHALYEPLLAILEDIRKRGITEIYSLGDNIGVGPNPSEVMDLLDEYNVKSVVGNHELYIIEGIEHYLNHLTTKYMESELNSNWTKNKLTEEQIDKIKKYPKLIEIVLGGKKIALCHYTKDYNTNLSNIDKKTYDYIFEGHIHFENKNDNIETLSGLAIGSSNNDYATYYILTEKENNFEIEKITVKYDKTNLSYDIIKSTMNSSDKVKIKNWIHEK